VSTVTMMLEGLFVAMPGRAVSVRAEGDRIRIEVGMPAPLPTYVVTVLPGTWTAEQIADGARRFERDAMHGLAMAGVP